MSDTDQAAVVEENVKDQETEPGEGTGEETPETQPEPEKPKPANELKVVIILRDDRIMLGVQSPDCDPVYETLKGTLAAALKRVPKLVEEAKTRWETSKLNPKCTTPLPSQEQPVTTSRPQKPAAPKAQPSMF
ncbi:unnamed protein product [marine sediment metagenome]|uniref:Uncharacterized protein n=1 Tax=marine sediment metagenome TaxID=412755 RepID=X1NMR1_9ZZZZ